MTRLYRPSSSQYWSRCPAQPSFSERLPLQQETDAAREGTCAAWVAEMVLNEHVTDCHSLLGETHENGWLVDEEMVSLVQEYVDNVKSLGDTITAEERIIASTEPLIQGTLDASVLNKEERILHVPDLKYGRRTVEVERNTQVIIYGYGKLQTLPPDTVDFIHLSIYQPRSFHVDGIFRKWVLTPSELNKEFAKLWSAANECEKPNPLAKAGEHCIECPVAASCIALSKTAYNLHHYVQSRDTRDMTTKELSQELNFMHEAKKTMTAKFKALEAEGEARCKNEHVQGWGLAPTFSNRVFNNSGTNIHLLTGVDPWEKKLCTPAELERRGAKKKDVKNLTKRSQTGLKLVRFKSDDMNKMFTKKD